MKKVFLVLLLCLLILIIIIIKENTKLNPTLKYTQEYEIGTNNIKGEVDIGYYTSKSKNFDIGANKYGYAVFKNPEMAFKTLKKQYKKGISLIQKEFYLFPLSVFNYKKYKVYGWQVNGGSSEEKEQARFVSSFMDIYENSYNIN